MATCYIVHGNHKNILMNFKHAHNSFWLISLHRCSLGSTKLKLQQCNKNIFNAIYTWAYWLGQQTQDPRVEGSTLRIGGQTSYSDIASTQSTVMALQCNEEWEL